MKTIIVNTHCPVVMTGGGLFLSLGHIANMITDRFHLFHFSVSFIYSGSTKTSTAVPRLSSKRTTL
ncbi:hypothetical protein [Neisseria meningitidis]|uniref:hypothetical protein n=1 Tax=Neisseria meningitidis TaxID=487 RepID=UPI0015D58258|nr:hypothetical protein [Neisseria meningitidis]